MAHLTATERHQVEQALALLHSIKNDLRCVEDTPAVTFRQLDSAVEEITKAVLDQTPEYDPEDEPF